METFLLLLGGFALGFLFIFLIRLGQGWLVNCTQCGQQHWVSPKKENPVCKKCGAPLKVEKKKPSQKSPKTGTKKKKGR